MRLPRHWGPQKRGCPDAGVPGEATRRWDAAEELAAAGEELGEAGGDIPPEMNPHSSRC